MVENKMGKTRKCEDQEKLYAMLGGKKDRTRRNLGTVNGEERVSCNEGE